MNTSRFFNVIKWALITNKKQYVRSFISMAVVLFLIIGANTMMFAGYPAGVNRMMMDGCSTLLIIAYCVATLAFAANSFLLLNDKHTRAQFLMLPATNLEKYLSRIVLFIGESVVMMLVSMAAADVLQMFISYIVCGEAVSVFPSFFSIVGAFFTTFEGCDSILVTFLLATIAVSSFVLGSTFFSKHQFIFTALAWVGFWVIFVTGVAGIGVALLKNLENIEIEFWFSDEVNKIIIDVVAYVVMVGIIVFNFWFSYRIFRKMNLVGRKFTNL